jgi:hypothetical protein
LYGGGGGSGGFNGSTPGHGGAGANGIIVVTYTPSGGATFPEALFDHPQINIWDH